MYEEPNEYRFEIKITQSGLNVKGVGKGRGIIKKPLLEYPGGHYPL